MNKTVEEEIKEIEKEFEQAKKPAWNKYLKINSQALQKYKKIESSAWNKYIKTTAPAFKKYNQRWTELTNRTQKDG